MKTILVLTDFSINADYVAQYALRMAQDIGANLMICNVYQVPAGEEPTDNVSWPMQAYEENSINDLGAQVAVLKSRLDVEVSGNGFRPDIEQCSRKGKLVDIINELSTANDIIMAVIGMHSTGKLSEFFATDHAWNIIDNAKFPVMVIPYQARFKPFRLIAFATIMNYTDISILQSLTGLAKYSNSEILVTHVTTEPKEESSIRRFFNQIPGKINYPQIIYNNVISSDVVSSLKKLCAHIDIDLLAIVHHKRSFFQTIFGESVSRTLANHPAKPLLIFPCNAVKATLTVF